MRLDVGDSVSGQSAVVNITGENGNAAEMRALMTYYVGLCDITTSLDKPQFPFESPYRIVNIRRHVVRFGPRLHARTRDRPTSMRQQRWKRRRRRRVAVVGGVERGRAHKGGIRLAASLISRNIICIRPLALHAPRTFADI